MAVVLLQPYAFSQKQTNWELRTVLTRQPIGAAYIVMLASRQYAFGIVGETRLSPLYTRGMLAVLDDELALLTRPIRR